MRYAGYGCAALTCALVVGCGGQARVAKLETRVATLESTPAPAGGDLDARVARLEATAARLEKVLAALEPMVGSNARPPDDTLEKLQAIASRLDDIQARIDRRAPPSPPRPGHPDPAAVYAVPVDGSPFIGPPDARVTIVRSFEFACPWCERSRTTMDELRKYYGKDLRIVYKHFIVHPQTATLPAYAACAAHEQHEFFAMEKAIWERAYHAGRDFSSKNLTSIARRVGLNIRKFRRDMNGEDCRNRVAGDRAMLANLGASGTPSFFINGRFLSGARPIDQFKVLIDEELTKAKQAIRGGVDQRDYYESIVRAGKTSR